MAVLREHRGWRHLPPTRTAMAGSGAAAVTAPSEPEPVVMPSTHYPYRADGRGVLYHLGVAAGNGQWKNPWDQGLVRVTRTPFKGRIGEARSLVEHCADLFDGPRRKCGAEPTRKDNRCYIEIALPFALKLTAYQFSQDRFEPLMTDWDLYGTDEVREYTATTWYSLAEHRNDKTFHFRQLRGAWQLNAVQSKGFRRFRIITPPNRKVQVVLLELFGDIES